MKYPEDFRKTFLKECAVNHRDSQGIPVNVPAKYFQNQFRKESPRKLLGIHRNISERTLEIVYF